MHSKAALSLVIFLMLVLTGCSVSTQREKLTEAGLLEEHQLSIMKVQDTIEGEVFGSFFLGTGSTGGSISAGSSLQFNWQPRPNEIVISSLPYDKFIFVVDEEKEVPTIQFVFKEYWLDRNELVEGIPDYTSDYVNLNDLINSHRLIKAKVRISSEDLKRELFLPQHP